MADPWEGAEVARKLRQILIVYAFTSATKTFLRPGFASRAFFNLIASPTFISSARVRNFFSRFISFILKHTETRPEQTAEAKAPADN